MAGGVAGDIRTPYPKGEDGVILVASHSFNVIASQTAERVDELELQWACKIVKAETCSTVMTIGTGITITVLDDTGTPIKFVDAKAAAVIAVGVAARTALVVDKTVQMNAGALLRFEYTSGSSDTSIDSIIRLWLKPVF